MLVDYEPVLQTSETSTSASIPATFAPGATVRVIVTPDHIDDVRMGTLTEEIARRIEAELQYPGQIKVVAIRETRAVDYAR